MADFSILAPVPRDHLESAREVVMDKDYVSFGSMKWDLFRRADELRNLERVPVLIYPSNESDVARLTYVVSWIGWYIGHVEDFALKRSDEKNGHRPRSTERNPLDNAQGWAIFWRVTGLRTVPEADQVPISHLKSYSRPGYWLKNSPPRGPEIVAYPEWFDSLFSKGEP